MVVYLFFSYIKPPKRYLNIILSNLHKILFDPRLRARTSIWFKKLINLFEVIGDKGYKGCENVVVCKTKEDRAQRQIVESVFSRLKQFNALSRWRKGITLLTYLYAYAIGYSFFRSGEVESWY